MKTCSYNSAFCDSVAKKEDVFTHHQYFTFNFCQCASDILSNAHFYLYVRLYSLSAADNLLCTTVSRNSFRLWSLHVSLHPKPSWFAWIAWKTIMLLLHAVKWSKEPALRLCHLKLQITLFLADLKSVKRKIDPYFVVFSMFFYRLIILLITLNLSNQIGGLLTRSCM